MTDKVEKLSAKLAKNRKNIEDAKRLIAYHKKMLKIYIRKESELVEKLEREQLDNLYKTVRDKGCDISAINEAIKSGEFSAENNENTSTENGENNIADFYNKNNEEAV
jgi:hypothetical protein